VHTSDGSSVELYKLLAARDEAAIIHSAVVAGGEVLELGAGAGRVTHGLLALGHPVTAVDSCAEMLAEIRGAEVIRADIVGLDLERQFPAVVLGSYLVNVVESDLRRDFLLTCARHVERDGLVFLECHGEGAQEWARMGASQMDANGVRMTWLDVAYEKGIVTGTLEFRFSDNVWTQSFSTHILSQAELARELAAVGLHLARRLAGNWVEARRIT